MRLWFKLRRLIARSWLLSRCYYPLRGARLLGRPNDQIWYFAYGANMHHSAFRVRRGIQPLEYRTGHVKGYQLRFNLEAGPGGRPRRRICAHTGTPRSGACSIELRGAT